MTVKLNIGAQGRIKATLTDVRDGSKQVIDQGNLLLNGIFNSWFTQNIRFLNENTLNTCFLGTGNTPPTPADTGLSGGTLASSSAGYDVAVDDLFADYEVEFDHPTGNVQYATFNKDDSLFVVLSDEAPFVTFYDVENGFAKLPITLDIENVPVFCDFSYDGKYLAINQIGTPALSIYDLTSDGARTDISGNIEGRAGDNCSFSIANELAVAYRVMQSQARIYELENNFAYYDFEQSTTFVGNGEVRFSPDGKTIAHTRTSNTGYWELRIYRRENLSERFSTLFLSRRNHGRYLEFIDNNTLAIAGVATGSVSTNAAGFHILDIESGNLLYYYSGYYYTTRRPTYSPIHKRLAWLLSSSGGVNSVPRVSWYPASNLAHGYYTVPSQLDQIKFSSTGRFLTFIQTSGQLIIHDLVPANPSSRKYTRGWTFPAGTGTGTVKELYLRTINTSPYSNTPVARVVLNSPIHKTEFHQLDVEWTIELKCDPVVSTYIENGQVDGSPVTCRFEHLHMMFFGICFDTAHTSWFGITGTPRLRLGDSNLETNAFFDYGIQGNEFVNFNTANIRISGPYVPDSLERTVRMFLEVDQGNEQPIAEMVMERFARLTFDPPLEKNASNRLYVDVTFKWERE